MQFSHLKKFRSLVVPSRGYVKVDNSSRNYDACGSPTKWQVMVEKKR